VAIGIPWLQRLMHQAKLSVAQASHIALAAIQMVSLALAKKKVTWVI
jgi:hypothetical protein